MIKKQEYFFETIKCLDNEVFNIHYHQKRIAKTVGLNINLNEYIYPPNDELLKCKIIYSYDGIIDISFTPYTIKNFTKFKLVYDDFIDYKYKSTIRDTINSLFDKKDDADDIIIIKNSLVTDTSIANIAIFDGNNWITPQSPLLEGTCRAKLLDEKFLILKNINIDDLKNAEAFAIMNAMLEFKIIEDFDIID